MVAWAEKLPASQRSRDPFLIAAINAALALRESASKLLPKERQFIQSLR